MLPTSASFLVTENCNLACKYCFEKHNTKRMSKDVARKALEFLSDNAVKEGVRDFHAMIFGGEPLLEIKMVDFIFHTGERLAREKGLRFSTSIVTNGTVMSEEIIDTLRWHKDSSNLTVQISVDGKKETQDLYRVTKSGKGSFDLLEKNIPIFKSLFEDAPHKLCFHGCVNKKTMGKLYENFMFFRNEWGGENIWFLPIMEENWDEDDVKTYDEQCGKIYDVVKNELIETRNVDIINKYAPMCKCFDHAFPQKACGAGDSFITVSAEGEFFPCHQIYFNDPDKTQKIGDVDSGINEEARKLYVEYTCDDIRCDHNCENNNCYRCIAVYFGYNHDILEPITGMYCKLMSVDKKYQDMLEQLACDLGLVNCDETHSLGNCLCNSRESGCTGNACDIVTRQSVCESGNNPDNPDCMCDVAPMRTEEFTRFEDTMATAMQVVLEELEEIKGMIADLKAKKDE